MPGIRGKNCYIHKDGRFLAYTRNCEQKASIGIIKSTLKIPPRHKWASFQSRSKAIQLKDMWPYFISNQDSTKGKDPK